MQVRLGNNLQLECESFGSTDAPAVLLIMGLGAQLLRWNIEICDGLVAAGYRVSASTTATAGCPRTSTRRRSRLWATSSRRCATARSPPSHTRSTTHGGRLCRPARRARHRCGTHRRHFDGGAIAQLVAAHHADRVLSLTCLMASSGIWPCLGPTLRGRSGAVCPAAT